MCQWLRCDKFAGHFPHRMSGQNPEKGLFTVVWKKFSEAILACGFKKSMIIFLIFFKTDKHQLDGFLFHIVFDHDFDFAADVLVEQKLNHFVFIMKLVDCLEKCLIYGHIRRFANWFYYSFTTFNGLSLDMQKAPAGCRIDRYTTLRGTSKRKNKITPPIRRRFSLLHWRTGTLLFYALMLRSKGKWSLDLCGS